MDYFLLRDVHRSIEWLISFLGDSAGFIVSLDGLTDEEVRLLRSAEKRYRRPLFAERS
jgi:hypothetical protein